MDSSARYKKFTIFQDEEEGEESRKDRKRQILILWLLVVTISVSISGMSVVAIGVAVGISASTAPQQEETSGLNVITVTLGKLEGEYYGSAGGIMISQCLFFTAIINAVKPCWIRNQT